MKIIDIDIVVPILVKEIKPNSIIIPKPTLISRGSSSIEVEQTFQCDVDYYGGVGIEQDGAVDAKLVKNPNTMTATLTGLAQDTEYTIKGVGLPILGNETIGEGLVVRTKASPIPDEYQLVEYIESNGGAHLNLDVYLTEDSYSILDCRQIAQPYVIFYGYNIGFDNADYRFFGTYFDIYGGRISHPNWTGRHIYELGNFYIKQDGVLVASGTKQAFTVTTSTVWLFGVAGGSSVTGTVYQLQIFNAQNSKNYNFYPVRRLIDNTVGLYDIINNVFVSDGINLIAGPDKEWEE